MCSEEIPKTENFYEEVIPRFSFATFKSHFRVTPRAFDYILSKISENHHFRKRSPEFGGREQVPIEKFLLVTLWTLATPESYRSIGDRFNISKSMVHFCLHTTVSVILEELCSFQVKWPALDERHFIAEGFSKYGIQNCIGIIDGTHIPIQKPSLNAYDYFNRKKFYSMILQGICRNDLRFIDVDIRWPGGVHDARVFRTSDMFPHGSELCAPNFFLIGDAAYPIQSWLTAPFRNHGHLTPAQLHFNTIISKTRVKIEHAFGLLKGRFRRLRNLLDMKGDQNIANTVVASCVLHNICILQGDDADIQDYINEGMNNLALFNLGNIHLDENVGGNELRAQLVAELWERRNQQRV